MAAAAKPGDTGGQWFGVCYVPSKAQDADGDKSFARVKEVSQDSAEWATLRNPIG